MMSTHTNVHAQRHPLISSLFCALTLLSPPSVLRVWPIYCPCTSPLYALLLTNISIVSYKTFFFSSLHIQYVYQTQHILEPTKNKVLGRVKGFLYQQLAWLVLNVSAVKLLLKVIFYTLLVGDSLGALWHFDTIIFCKKPQTKLRIH